MQTNSFAKAGSPRVFLTTQLDRLVTWVSKPGLIQAQGYGRNGAIADRALKVGAATAALAAMTWLAATMLRAGAGDHGSAVTDLIVGGVLMLLWFVGKGARGIIGRLLSKVFLVFGVLCLLDAVRFLLI